MTHVYYSQRTGSNPHPDGLSLSDTLDLFKRSYIQLEREGYFTEPSATTVLMLLTTSKERSKISIWRFC
jgi:hypothetical protein